MMQQDRYKKIFQIIELHNNYLLILIIYFPISKHSLKLININTY